MTARPLFIPLYREYFDKFADGSKTRELRPYGPRWNELTCRIGRDVVLSNGYSKHGRLCATVTGFHHSTLAKFEGTRAEKLALRKVYGFSTMHVAVIQLSVRRWPRIIEGKLIGPPPLLAPPQAATAFTVINGGRN